MENIRVLIADDHPIFREGLARLFRDEEGLECVGVAKDGEEALELTQRLQPDVAILDADMPKISGIDAARQIKKTCPNTAVLILSAYDYHYFVTAAIQAGVDGYLLKDTSRSELIQAIHMVRSGKGIFSLEATGEILLGTVAAASDTRLGFKGLHSREIEVLRLAAKGLGNKQIANELGIAENTVGTHLANIFRKLGVKSRTEAALLALKKGLFSLGDTAEKQGT